MYSSFGIHVEPILNSIKWAGISIGITFRNSSILASSSPFSLCCSAYANFSRTLPDRYSCRTCMSPVCGFTNPNLVSIISFFTSSVVFPSHSAILSGRIMPNCCIDKIIPSLVFSAFGLAGTPTTRFSNKSVLLTVMCFLPCISTVSFTFSMAAILAHCTSFLKNAMDVFLFKLPYLDTKVSYALFSLSRYGFNSSSDISVCCTSKRLLIASFMAL